MDFSGKFGSSSPIWYPAAGELGDDDGSGSSLSHVGSTGEWWGGLVCYITYLYENNVNTTLGGNRRARGHSVRCQKE